MKLKYLKNYNDSVCFIIYILLSIIICIIALIYVFPKTKKTSLSQNIKTPCKDDKIEYFAKIMKNKYYAELSIKYAAENDLDVSLLVAVMKIESSFNPKAVNYNSNSIDRGLCQLNSLSFSYLKENEAFDPETNIKIASAFLSWCIREADENIIKALAYYNAGIRAVQDKNIGEHTLNYIFKVINAKEKYDRELSQIINNEEIKL